jgi:parallel beta-helix repeat protein
VVDCTIEHNSGPGIWLNGAAQINLQGNVIEGNYGVGVMACAIWGFTVLANYFEGNNMHASHCQDGGCMALAPASGGGRNLTLRSDIVLNGEPSLSAFAPPRESEPHRNCSWGPRKY